MATGNDTRADGLEGRIRNAMQRMLDAIDVAPGIAGAPPAELERVLIAAESVAEQLEALCGEQPKTAKRGQP